MGVFGSAESISAHWSFEAFPIALMPFFSPGDYPIKRICDTLNQILGDEKVLRYSAKASFKQFDFDNNRLLDFGETKAFLKRFCENLAVPPISDAALQAIFEKYDTKGRGGLSINDFLRMYKALLVRIRHRFYPPGLGLIRSSIWVPFNAVGHCTDIGEIFRFEKRFSGGSFGEAFQVTDMRTGEPRALKIINKANVRLPLEQIVDEIRILKEVDHPNVVKIFEVFEDHNSVYIVQEVCQGGELLADVGRYRDEMFVRRVIREVLDGLSYLHSKRILHKDLKPPNIMFADRSSDAVIKIIDFGLGEIFTNEHQTTCVVRGSAAYMAPEAFTDGVLCLKSDVWSVGVIAVQLLTGSLVYNAVDLREFRETIARAEPPLDQLLSPNLVSQPARDLIMAMLQKDSAKRPTAVQARKFPWFADEFQSTILKDGKLTQSMIGNLRAFARQASLRNLFVTLMAQQLTVTNTKVKDIARRFKALDEFNTGLIGEPEIKKVLRSVNLSKWEINLIIQKLDVVGIGQISYTEFLAACYSWRESEMNLMWNAFRRVAGRENTDVLVKDLWTILFNYQPDKNATGKLFSRDEINEVGQMLAEIDKDGDGRITWVDFEVYMRKG